MEIIFLISLATPRPSQSEIHWPINSSKKNYGSVYFQKKKNCDKFIQGYPSWWFLTICRILTDPQKLEHKHDFFRLWGWPTTPGRPIRGRPRPWASWTTSSQGSPGWPTGLSETDQVCIWLVICLLQGDCELHAQWGESLPGPQQQLAGLRPQVGLRHDLFPGQGTPWQIWPHLLAWYKHSVILLAMLHHLFYCFSFEICYWTVIYLYFIDLWINSSEPIRFTETTLGKERPEHRRPATAAG